MSSYEFMEHPAKKGFLTKLLVACCGGPFLDGYVMSIIGVALVGVSADLQTTASEMGMIGAASLVGIFIGAGAFGFLTDRYGREKMYAADLIVLVIACALSVFVQEAWHLIALRFVIGMAIGADYPIATSLLTEFTPSKKRGFMVGASAAAWSAGAVSAYLVGAIVVGLTGSNENWRLLLASTAVLGVIVILLRRGIPESPRWLTRNGRVAEAEQVAKQIYNVDVSLADAEGAGVVGKRVKIDLKPLFRGEYLRRLIMCSVLYIAVVTPLYGLVTFLPALLEGFNIDGGGVSGMWVETVILAITVAGSLIAMSKVDRWGRRPLAVYPLLLMALPLLGLWLWADGPIWFVLVAFCAYNFFSGGPSILVWIYPNELFPTEYRASAVGIATAASRFGAATGTYLLPLSLEAFGSGTTMLFGAVLTMIAFVVVVAMAPETRGRSLEQTGSIPVVAAMAR
ncbi:MFS transporter [Leucobacter coleopterorum]|uniref:MFS transporter n=1 Tax=Leucobacter coleopterorum TaxID=2714933 RepID=A0ABX6JZI8_9MICO|nr:MFS transporter [Leucobacter coleopterorum]QIM18382.1 MFS transporter [Leucobacter coleopterorum]